MLSSCAITLTVCLTAISGSCQTPGTHTFGRLTGDTNEDWTAAASQDSAESLEFTVMPGPTYTLGLAFLSFDAERGVDEERPSEDHTPLQSQARIFEGVSLRLVRSQDFGLDETVQDVVVNFLTFTTLAGEMVTIRFYSWDAGLQDGGLNFDDVALSGTLTLVPEPSPAVLMGFGVLLFLGRCVLRRAWLERFS